MISEVVNALFLTFLATEYTAASSSGTRTSGDEETKTTTCGTRFLSLTEQQRRITVVALVVVIVNVFDATTGAGAAIVAHSIVVKFLHIPKVIFAAILYVLALYKDCQTAISNNSDAQMTNNRRSLDFKSDFLPKVTKAFCRILPVYPVAAVLISFGFLFVINLFELLHLPVNLLNWPIYYGTLYGPFSYIYFTVKRNVVRESRNTLPVSMNCPPRRLGSV